MRTRWPLHWWRTGSDDDDHGSGDVEIDDDGAIVDNTQDK